VSGVRARAVLWWLVAAWCVPSPAAAQLCSITATPVTFGSYDVLAPAPLDSMGSVTYQCLIGVNVIITLSRGSAPSFAPRRMTNGAEALGYNLYLNPGRTIVWGDGSGGTSRYSALVALLLPVSVQVYGRVPAGQNVAAGAYGDTVVATIIF